MTDNEAKERLECMRLFMQIEDAKNESKFLEDDYVANKMAIQALEEIQQYRVIGTVEELINTQIREKVLNVEVQSYKEIGTIEEFKALKEKENEDFNMLLKAVKESYPMSKGAYVELDVFMGDVMSKFAKYSERS